VDFAEGIEKILDMSFPKEKGTVRGLINSYAREFSENKKSIIEGKVPAWPVRLAISFICSRSGRWAALGIKAREQLEGRNLMDLLKERELNSFLDNVYTRHGRAYKESKEKISQFLTALEGLNNELKGWPKNERVKRFEQKIEKILETQAHIGRKGRDNILRDCGFLNYIPIDVHEQRFLLRTGIFHKYASLTESDPTDYDHLANAMSRFSKNELNELEVNGTRLSEAPGLVDLIIWHFSQEKTEKEISLTICAKDPKCEKCPLKNLCLFAKLHS